ncbi:DNA-binding GntR family transcriptional regulator [Arthrobacter pigmenti]|uniref:DNA-binding GntR family transcriptional regulator n=1 Tax=Arthrobacter pigmenti TaxID=271432 RepID=A0A846RW15_9MICC|nr:GntR family transcriptional regulator [Arthrobacter pigmenti]NJC23785.1 DNA-binding GntR family transcriptional regulator [Arthrobacter pigmenti]
MSTLDSTWSPEMGRIAAPLREQVVATLRRAILDRAFDPGQRLVERELIERLGVSRTTVREAIRELASEGLVTVIPQRGAIVSSPSLAEAIDLYEVRAALESILVARFTERADEKQVVALQITSTALARCSSAAEEISNILEAKDRFYGALLEGAESPVLAQLLSGIQARVQILRATSLSAPGRITEAASEIEGIVAAIERRDAKEASQLMAAHIRAAAETALGHLSPSEVQVGADHR